MQEPLDAMIVSHLVKLRNGLVRNCSMGKSYKRTWPLAVLLAKIPGPIPFSLLFGFLAVSKARHKIELPSAAQKRDGADRS